MHITTKLLNETILINCCGFAGFIVVVLPSRRKGKQQRRTQNHSCLLYNDQIAIIKFNRFRDNVKELNLHICIWCTNIHMYHIQCGLCVRSFFIVLLLFSEKNGIEIQSRN